MNWGLLKAYGVQIFLGFDEYRTGTPIFESRRAKP